MATIFKKLRKSKETKEELEETKGEKLKKNILCFFIIELNLFLARYPVSGKIIGRISGIRKNYPAAGYAAKSVSLIFI